MARYDRIDKRTNVKAQFHGQKLASKRWCGQNNNFLKISKPRRFENLFRFIGDQKSDFGYPLNSIPAEEWVLVNSTDNISINSLAEWPEMSLLKGKMCSDRPDMPLMFEVYDYKTNSGSHELVGGAVLTYNELIKKVGLNISLVGRDGKNQGELIIRSFSESKFQFNH